MGGVKESPREVGQTGRSGGGDSLDWAIGWWLLVAGDVEPTKRGQARRSGGERRWIVAERYNSDWSLATLSPLLTVPLTTSHWASVSRLP